MLMTLHSNAQHGFSTDRSFHAPGLGLPSLANKQHNKSLLTKRTQT